MPAGDMPLRVDKAFLRGFSRICPIQGMPGFAQANRPRLN